MKKPFKIIIKSLITSFLGFTALLCVSLFIIVAPFVSVWSASYGIYNNYIGWKRVEVPTETTMKATVWLRKNWFFTSDGERLYIKDEDGKIIATEVYEDWRILHTTSYPDGRKETFDNKNEIDVNKNLPEELQDIDVYKPYKVGEGSCYIYKAETEDRIYYALIMNVIIAKGKDYQLMLVFNDDTVTEKDFKKIQTSYRYGGYIKE